MEAKTGRNPALNTDVAGTRGPQGPHVQHIAVAHSSLHGISFLL